VLDALRPTEMSGMSIYGLAVRTTGVDLTDAAIDALITHRVDVLDVLLDAWTPELYAQLQSPGTSHERADMDAVLRSLDRLADARQRRGSVYPLVVPEFTKVH